VYLVSITVPIIVTQLPQDHLLIARETARVLGMGDYVKTGTSLPLLVCIHPLLYLYYTFMYVCMYVCMYSNYTICIIYTIIYFTSPPLPILPICNPIFLSLSLQDPITKKKPANLSALYGDQCLAGRVLIFHYHLFIFLLLFLFLFFYFFYYYYYY
jgi:hypothetical protein